MTKKFFVLALSVLLTMPCWLHAEEVVIPLMEVTEMGLLPGDNPLDDPDHSPNNPPRPTNFRATIDGTTLVVTKQESASTGSIVVNQPFTTSITQQISTPGVYALRIHTAGGDLIGQFIVQ